MAQKRSVIKKLDVASGAATTTIALGAPAWTKYAVLMVLGTTAAASTVDAKIVQSNPDGTGTDIDTGVAIDQIAASSTNAQRYAAWGVSIGAATSGTNIDSFVIPVSKHQKLTVTIAGTVTALKVWVEFVGE